MKRVRFTMLAGMTAALTACSHAPQTVVTPRPNPDSLLASEREDSLRAQAAALAAAQAQQLAGERHADSLAALARASDELKQTLQQLIHFDFDQAMLTAEDVATLDRKIPVLRANPALRIEVAGNCDERGSEEYNLALGNRRAIAAKAYLVAHGIDGSRISAISNGKERPLAGGHNEQAWAQNRNDQFDILTASVVLREP